MTDPVEVTVLGPAQWSSRLEQLLALLDADPPLSAIPDPTGRTPDPERIAVVRAPALWRAFPAELAEALSFGPQPAASAGSSVSSGALAPMKERLTLTVEEAATLLGISRAFAYEAVTRGEIPSLRIGRRILVPKAALQRFLQEGPLNPG